MQDIDIFQYSDYREYLNKKLPAKGESRGERKKLAAHLGCQPGFISQVLSGKSDFSAEHGLQIGEFLRLNGEEISYFLLLLNMARAGSVTLKKHYEGQIYAIQKEKDEIRSRIITTHSLSLEEQLLYYESWLPTALHMCTLVPSLRNSVEIKNYLNVTLEQVKDALEILFRVGLVEKQNSNYVSTKKRIHLSEKGMSLKKHHTNWRLQAIQSLERNLENALHYTSIMSISQEAMEEIKAILLKSIESTESVIKSAKDEGVYALTLDLFEVGSR